jgi:hypothetical protein
MSNLEEIQNLLTQIGQQLEQIELEATEGITIATSLLEYFPNNLRLIQLFANLNNSLLFRDNIIRRVQLISQSISSPNVSTKTIEEAGEDLSELLGRVIETKILVSSVVKILKELI